MITIEVKSDPVDAALAQLGRAVSDLTPAFDTIGDGLLRYVRDGFESGADPFGHPWKPLKNPSPKRRAGKPLVDTGALMRSFVRQSGTRDLVIGTNSVYAAIHQFGGMAGRNRATPIPARPTLPTETLPADWEQEIVSVVQRYLVAAMEGHP